MAARASPNSVAMSVAERRRGIAGVAVEGGPSRSTVSASVASSQARRAAAALAGRASGSRAIIRSTSAQAASPRRIPGRGLSGRGSPWRVRWITSVESPPPWGG